jgi:threonyl-tRNA synthetase
MLYDKEDMVSNIRITLPDGSVREYPAGSTGRDVAMSISQGLARKAIAIKAGETILDLDRKLTTDTTLTILTAKDDDVDALHVLRHSAAHVLAEAICELFPGTKLAYGPAIDNGFFYDLSTPKPISQDDFEAIEKKMAEIVKEDRAFVRCEYTANQGLERTAGDKYKTDNAERAIERAKNLGEEPVLSFYTTGTPGQNWEDLCAGPHVPSTSFLKNFKIMSVAGAYWHGDQNSDKLTRVYGTCFASKDGLKEHLTRLEEAKKRDHRRIGKEMDLFHLEEHSPGMVFWHAKGTALYNILVDYIRRKITLAGYQEVRTPEVVEKTLWEKSGHWDKYSEMMFTTSSENRTFAVKPMNCPCHITIFNQGLKSWRDLPIRMAEFGKCHRNELAGTMHGIMRVRGFVQDDAHIFCTEDQIADEVAAFCTLLKEVYGDFGFSDILVKFSTRPEKRVGTDESWDKVEAALSAACDKAGLVTQLNPGEGAFYGPKLEFVLRDCLGRDWQCGTIQVDPNLPERLGAEYVAPDGSKKHPYMLHRAILGSLERFIGILIEQFAGDFPFWLHPEQIRVLPISEKYFESAKELAWQLKTRGYRVELDQDDAKIGAKIRQAELGKVPFTLIVGEKEAESGGATLRQRKVGDLGLKSVEELLAFFAQRNTPGFLESSPE